MSYDTRKLRRHIWLEDTVEYIYLYTRDTPALYPSYLNIPANISVRKRDFYASLLVSFVKLDQRI